MISPARAPAWRSRRDAASPFPERVRGWVASADPSRAGADLAARADDVTARWSGADPATHVLHASPHLDRVSDSVELSGPPAAYGLGVQLGKGPDGEPVYYAAVGFRAR